MKISIQMSKQKIADAFSYEGESTDQIFLTSKEVPPDSQWHRWAEIACVVEQPVESIHDPRFPVGRRQLVRNMCRQNRMTEEKPDLGHEPSASAALTIMIT
jgi:hypothetical protein